jgi:ATP phosphoribosyltransferase
VETLGQLRYSKNTERPVRIVVAVPEESPWSSVSDLPQGVKVSTEYPSLTSKYFLSKGVDADIQLSYGATEAKAPEIVDAVVDITETGRALRAAGLKIIDTILTSYTELIANPASFVDPEKRQAMEQIRTLLQGVLDARGKVMVKMNVLSDNLGQVLDKLPSMKSPTVNELSKGDGFAVETVVEKDQINILIPDLREAGATDIIELPISKIVP